MNAGVEARERRRSLNEAILAKQTSAILLTHPPRGTLCSPQHQDKLLQCASLEGACHKRQVPLSRRKWRKLVIFSAQELVNNYTKVEEFK